MTHASRINKQYFDLRFGFGEPERAIESSNFAFEVTIPQPKLYGAQEVGAGWIFEELSELHHKQSAHLAFPENCRGALSEYAYGRAGSEQADQAHFRQIGPPGRYGQEGIDVYL